MHPPSRARVAPDKAWSLGLYGKNLTDKQVAAILKEQQISGRPFGVIYVVADVGSVFGIGGTAAVSCCPCRRGSRSWSPTTAPA